MENSLVWNFIAHDKASKVAEGIGATFKKIGEGALLSLGEKAAEGVIKFGEALFDGVKAADEYQKLGRATEAVIKSTGNAAGVSVKGVRDMASSLEGMAAVDEDLIQNSENVLLTFTKIQNKVGSGNDIFNQATKAALDLSSALHTDLQTSSIQVGKALNDPVKGITALSKVGVSFTKEQKYMADALVNGGIVQALKAMGNTSLTTAEFNKVLKEQHGDVNKAAAVINGEWNPALQKTFDHLSEGGHTMEAQKMILKELSVEFGGAAKAAGEGFGGAVFRLKDKVSDFFRDLGLKLLPKLTEFTNWLIDKGIPALADFGNEMGPKLKPLVDSLVGSFKLMVSVGGDLLNFYKDHKTLVESVAVAVGTAIVVIKAITTAQEVWTAATKLAAGAQVFLKTTMAAVGGPVGLIIIGIAALAAGLIYAYKHSETFRNVVDKAMNGAKIAFGWVWDKAKGFFDWVKSNWPTLLIILTGPIGLAVVAISKNWDTIKAAALAVWNWLKDTWQSVKNFITGPVADAGKSVSNTWDSIKTSAKNTLDSVIKFFKDLPGNITSAVGNLKTLLTDKGKDVITGFWNGLKEIWETVKTWVAGIGNWIKDNKGPVSLDKGLLVPAGKAIMEGFLTGLKSGAGKAWDFVKSVGGKTKEAVAEVYGWIKGLGWNPLGGSNAAGAGVQRWADVALAALKAAGAPSSWLGDLLRRMQQESGGDPYAINLWDINAKNGTPSKGLMQVIGPTFAAYAGQYYSRGIYDPFANIYAAIRYTIARYGSGPAGWNRSGGYDRGGMLRPGYTLAYNGTGANEHILTGEQFNSIVNGSGETQVNVYLDGELVRGVAAVEVRRGLSNAARNYSGRRSY